MVETKTNIYMMSMSLERHFRELQAQNDNSIKELYSLYELLKKRLEDRMLTSRSTFANYSLHDASHSRSVIHAVERFLGAERICALSPTDTFMLLICAYAHDYGMAYSYNKIYDILGSDKFEDFLKKQEKELSSLEKEDATAVENLMGYLDRSKTSIPLQDIYWSISLAIQLYLRSDHWLKVIDLNNDFKGLFESHLKARFLCGSEGIAEICMCHGKDFHSLFQLSPMADGITGIINDDFHPRFIAAMLRLGDLLDIDNDRFPIWFVHEAAKNQSIIPKLSLLHYRKHESISHLLITEKKIAIRADCDSSQDGYETARIVCQWTDSLKKECQQLRSHWDEIAPENFRTPPADPGIQIYVDNRPYLSVVKEMQMQMSQERVMNLLKGTSIYRDEYVGIREVIQNAVDASLLQMWEDIIHNRYLNYKLSKDNAKNGLKLTDLMEESRYKIFSNYNITVEVIKDLEVNKVLLVVKDKGIGISLEDMKYIANIGSSRENNPRLQKLMKKMPEWMKPSGIFGIGLQSVFQLSDCIEFYTRLPNQPERLITFYSYGKNKGKIDVRDIPSGEDDIYFDNTVPGTNTKIAIDPAKMLSSECAGGSKRFFYYDTEFDAESDIEIAYAEICRICKDRIKSVKCDYFNIKYQEIIHEGKGKDIKPDAHILRRSYFDPYVDPANKKNYAFINLSETLNPLLTSKDKPYSFTDSSAYFWDEKHSRSYTLKIRPCKIKSGEAVRQVFLPDATQNLYHVSYKFNTISNTETIYHSRNYAENLRAGFIEWDILILDGNPTRYLNIDRESLRENAISEEELLKVRSPILEKWCAYFCGLDAKKQDKNRFEKKPEILISLIMLFFQNVPDYLFRKFASQYQGYLESMNLFVGTDQIPITDLWNPKQTFQTGQELPGKYVAFESDASDDNALKIKMETLNHIPYYLVKIDSISSSRDRKLIYRFHFGSAKTVYTVQMNEVARLVDYMQIFDPYNNQPKKIDYASVQKKVFKPDKKYPHLALPCYPHTFSRGRNLSSYIDCCIVGYILSPFDMDTANILKEGVEKNEEVLQKLMDAVKKSTQFHKCVRYVLKKRYADESDPEQMKKVIIGEYEDFIKNLYGILRKHRLLVMEQFQSNSGEIIVV